MPLEVPLVVVIVALSMALIEACVLGGVTAGLPLESTALAVTTSCPASASLRVPAAISRSYGIVPRLDPALMLLPGVTHSKLYSTALLPTLNFNSEI